MIETQKQDLKDQIKVREIKNTALIDGEEIEYDVCGDSEHSYDRYNVTYIGSGYVKSVEGEPYRSDKKYAFFVAN